MPPKMACGWANPDAWSAQRAHLDPVVNSRLHSYGSSESGVYYKFELMEKTPLPDSALLGHKYTCLTQLHQSDILATFIARSIVPPYCSDME